MRLFRNKWFTRFAVKQGITDADLCEAIDRAESGQIDADLGGNVIKQRLARQNEGRSGGFRSIILLRSGERAFFVYAFAKNQRENIRPDELRAFRALAAEILSYSEAEIDRAIRSGALFEVICSEKDV